MTSRANALDSGGLLSRVCARCREHGRPLVNTMVLLAALATAVGLASAHMHRHRSTSLSATRASPALRDATGHRVAVAEYRRIASASTVADAILREIVANDCIVAVSAHTRRNAPGRWRYEAWPGIESLRDLEAIVALKPDLVLTSHLNQPRLVERLRSAEITVFDLGPIRGAAALRHSIRALARLLGVPARGEWLVRRFDRRFARVAAGVEPQKRVWGMYLGLHAGELYGGAQGTSFYDVLQAAGVRDVATRAGYRLWPTYSGEDLLRLDPPWIVTNQGSEPLVCRHPSMDKLTACRSGQVRGVPRGLLSAAGLDMVDAAEAVHDAVYAREASSGSRVANEGRGR